MAFFLKTPDICVGHIMPSNYLLLMTSHM